MTHTSTLSLEGEGVFRELLSQARISLSQMRRMKSTVELHQAGSMVCEGGIDGV
ncbi:hypothetical protein DSTSK_06540 [Desulforhabdus sp. TSK]|nr:hypothetical protein DSTSK_06540 [Desulforhabdus sp. TSK]